MKSLIVIAIAGLMFSSSYAKERKVKRQTYEHTNPYTAQNGSSYNDLNDRSRYKTDYVKPHTNNNGTTVRGHYRSRKSR